MADFINLTPILNTTILFMLVITALAVIFAKNLITSTIILCLFSLLMAAQYLIMGAVDVAITEAAVGAGISTILFLLALFLVGDQEKFRPGHNYLIHTCIIGIITAILLYATFDLPSFGAKYAPAQIHVSPYYLTYSQAETGIPNVVTSILASYRGFDTLGETFVIFTAVISVILLIGRFKKVRTKNGQ